MLLDRRLFLAGAGAGLLLPGCTSRAAPGAMEAVPLESLVRQIKHDIGSYIFHHQDDSKVPAAGKACGGQVGFTIQKVKMIVTATFDRASSANAGLKVPLNLVTLEAGISAAESTSDMITTSLTIWPLTAGPDAELEDESVAGQRLTAVPPPSPDFEGTPIADAMNRLRNDLLKTADTPPCFDFGQGEQRDNFVKWAFTIGQRSKADAKLSLKLFAVGGEISSARTFANTIEASFLAIGEGFG